MFIELSFILVPAVQSRDKSCRQTRAARLAGFWRGKRDLTPQAPNFVLKTEGYMPIWRLLFGH